MQIRIIASSTMVQHSIRCMICGRPVDHRVVFMTNDARVLHAGCLPDHVKVPSAVLLQAIRRLERMVERARAGSSPQPGDPEPAGVRDLDSHDRAGGGGDHGSLPGPNGHGGPVPARPAAQGRDPTDPGPLSPQGREPTDPDPHSPQDREPTDPDPLSAQGREAEQPGPGPGASGT